MSYKEYWYGPTWLIRDYLNAEKYKRDQKNFESWQLGIYVAKAISSTIGNAFLEKGAEPDTYPEKPIPFFEDEVEEDKEAKEDRETELADLYLKQFVEFGKKWGEQP